MMNRDTWRAIPVVPRAGALYGRVMSDRLFFALAVVIAVAMTALALVWP